MRQSLDEALDHVRRERATIVCWEARGEKPYAVLVAVDDEETVQAIEDVIDARATEKALAAMKRKGEKPLPTSRSARNSPRVAWPRATGFASGTIG